MANEIRLRQNFASGTITDNPLTNVATTINSAAFANLPAVTATSHLPIVLDPTASAGAPEIAYITAHTAAATSATVVRGQEGTSARQHAQGMTWRHSALVSDYDSVIGYAQAVLDQTAITTQVDLTSLTTTVTVPYAGHRIRITGEVMFSSNNAGDTGALFIMEGATQLTQAQVPLTLANQMFHCARQVVVVPSAAAHTYKLQAARGGAGTFNMKAAATYPAFILVEDLGPAA